MLRWALALVVLAVACSSPSGDADAIDALSGRIGALASEVAGVREDLQVALATEGYGNDQVIAEKAAFEASVTEATIADAILQHGNALESVEEVRFDAITDSLVIRARAGSDAGAAAWQAAQAVAPLFEMLNAYAPVVDLQVDELRCACSTALMKEVAAQRADREVWERTCGT